MLIQQREHIFRVGSLGFENQERVMLRNLLGLSECRTPIFKPLAQGEMTHPHIIILNADCAEAMANWRRYCQHADAKIRTVPIFLTRSPTTQAAAYWLYRPIVAGRLFALLEQIVTENHGFEPVLASRPQDPLIVLAADEVATPGATTALPIDDSNPAAEVDPMPAPDVRDITALVIDDSLPVQMQMLAALHPIAAHIDFADRAVRAMEFLESGLYSVVFLDVMLPDADSYDVCQRIRRHPRHKNTPVVMLAGRTAPADRLKGTAAGCNAYLIKPVRQAILQQILGQFVHAPAELA
jgi:two-component system cell cycle response regulator